MPKAFLVTNRRYGIENGGKNSSNDCTKGKLLYII